MLVACHVVVKTRLDVVRDQQPKMDNHRHKMPVDPWSMETGVADAIVLFI